MNTENCDDNDTRLRSGQGATLASAAKTTARQAYCQLLVTVFTDAELRQFVGMLPAEPPPVPPLDVRLPGVAATLAELAYEAVRLLERESMVTESLDQLEQVRPRSRAVISEVRRLYRL